MSTAQKLEDLALQMMHGVITNSEFIQGALRLIPPAGSTEPTAEYEPQLFVTIRNEFFIHDAIDSADYPIVSVAHFDKDCIITFAHTRNGPREYAVICTDSVFFRGLA